VGFASSSGKDWSKVWAALQDCGQLRTLNGMPSTTLAWNFQKFRTLKSLTLTSGRVQPEVDGHLPASLVDLVLEGLSSFDEDWFRWQDLSKLENLTLIDIHKEEFKTICKAFEVSFLKSEALLQLQSIDVSSIRSDVHSIPRSFRSPQSTSTSAPSSSARPIRTKKTSSNSFEYSPSSSRSTQFESCRYRSRSVRSRCYPTSARDLKSHTNKRMGNLRQRFRSSTTSSS